MSLKQREIPKKIAYQGIEGSYSYFACKKVFNKKDLLLGQKTFLDVFEKVQNNEVDMGLLPVENSLVGSIVENFDLLLEYPEIFIVLETFLPINHALLGKKDCMGINELKKVFSHPKALEQCKDFFKKYPRLEPQAAFDTAGAALEITPQTGAIMHKKIALYMDLKCLRRRFKM